MRETKKLFLLPTILLPYLICLYIVAFPMGWTILTSEEGILSWTVRIDIGLAVVCNILYMIFAIKIDPDRVLWDALFLKACHIAPYVVIFLTCVLLFPMFIMTFPLLLVFFILDLIFLWLGDMISLYALIRSVKRGGFRALKVVTMLCQFFFCADVISLLITNLVIRASKPGKSLFRANRSADPVDKNGSR